MTRSALPEALVECRKRLEQKGFNLWGVTRIGDFDAYQCREGRLSDVQDGCLSVIVIGNGGSGLWRLLKRIGVIEGHPRHAYDPLDRYSRRAIGEEVRELRDQGYGVCAVYPFDRRPVDFLRLAEAAGIGVVSPVVPFLLHPIFGPWISLRGAIVVDEELTETDDLDEFDPCLECTAPCLRACPVGVFPAAGYSRLDRCADHRHRGGCVSGCQVRRACPVGQEHRYDPDEEAFRHAYSLPTLRRYFGKGWWKLLPAGVRRRVRL